MNFPKLPLDKNVKKVNEAWRRASWNELWWRDESLWKQQQKCDFHK